MSENFAQLFEASLSQIKLVPGSVINAEIVAIDEDTDGFITVNAGLKSEGRIAKSEFVEEGTMPELHIGDHVKVILVQFDEDGETIFSREMARRNETWDELETKYANKETVIGVVTGKVKGGLTVEIGKVRAFLPGSLIDVRTMRESDIEGKTLELKVIKLDRKKNNIVVSRRAAIEETSTERVAVMENIQEGKVVKGVVKNLTDYGAFVDLGGVDGLLHKTHIAWRRINHPNEVLNIGDEVTVIVLKIDKDKGRVSLGMKQLDEDPWHGLASQFPKGAKIKGKVTNIADYGCFVEIKSGVEGLVHQSEMDWTNKNIAPNKVVQIGQDVEVMVLEIDEESRRISLGIKQCVANPWESFVASHQKGDQISGQIKSITDFGIFIGLPGDIDGLVHASDISWTIAPEVAIRDFKKGQEVTAVILAMDAERERISLGIKQLEADAFGSYTDEHPRGHIVKGKVIEIDPKGVTVELAAGVTGTIRTHELAVEKVEDPNQIVKMDQEIEAKVVNVDKKNRVIHLSIKALLVAEEAEVVREYTQKSESSATLGDLLKEQMQQKEQD